MNKKRWFGCILGLFVALMMVTGASAAVTVTAPNGNAKEAVAGQSNNSISDIVITEGAAGDLKALQSGPAACAGQDYTFEVTIQTPGITWNYAPTLRPELFSYIPGQPNTINPRADYISFADDNLTAVPNGVSDLRDIAAFANQKAFDNASAVPFCYAQTDNASVKDDGHPVAVVAPLAFSNVFDAVVSEITGDGKTLVVSVIRRSGTQPGKILLPGNIFTVNASGTTDASDLVVAVNGQDVTVAQVLPPTGIPEFGGSQEGPVVSDSIASDLNEFWIRLDVSPTQSIANGRLFVSLAIPTSRIPVTPSGIQLGDLVFFRPADELLPTDNGSVTAYLVLPGSQPEIYFKKGALNSTDPDALFKLVGDFSDLEGELIVVTSWYLAGDETDVLKATKIQEVNVLVTAPVPAQ